MPKKVFDPAKINLLGKLRKIDHHLDYIRLPENKTTVEGKPLKEWMKEVSGTENTTDYFLLAYIEG